MGTSYKNNEICLQSLIHLPRHGISEESSNLDQL